MKGLLTPIKYPKTVSNIYPLLFKSSKKLSNQISKSKVWIFLCSQHATKYNDIFSKPFVLNIDFASKLENEENFFFVII